MPVDRFEQISAESNDPGLRNLEVAMSQSQMEFSQSLLRTAALDSLYAEFGKDLPILVTEGELAEMIEERTCRILRRHGSMKQAA